MLLSVRQLLQNVNPAGISFDSLLGIPVLTKRGSLLVNRVTR